eukprot:1143836-Pelagomonas_calceolata.AAC.2
MAVCASRSEKGREQGVQHTVRSMPAYKALNGSIGKPTQDGHGSDLAPSRCPPKPTFKAPVLTPPLRINNFQKHRKQFATSVGQA